MARSFFPALIVASCVIGAAAPASAQFESIFGRGPPRPPADVPSVRSAPNNFPPPIEREEQPPAQSLPGPGDLPPADSSAAVRPGAIQSQPLPPPPGSPPPPVDTALPGRPAGPNTAVPGTPAGPQPPAEAAPQPGDEVVIEPPAQKITNPTAVFAGLDKITGRIISFDVAIGETVQFGALQVTPHVCYTRPPTETPNTDAFVDVDEVTLQGEVKRIFTGWMFASSPGLHAVEHPIYDVWLTDCKGGAPAVASSEPEDGAAAKAHAKPAPPKPPARSVRRR